MSNDTVLMDRHGAVAVLTLNNPKTLNALDPDMIAAMPERLKEAGDDDTVRAIILRGGENFISGGDVRFFHRLTQDAPPDAREQMEQKIEEVHRSIHILRTVPKPVVAAVRGACAGFGMSLMMGCDLAVAADDALFTLAYVHIGTSPDGGSTYGLPRMVGHKRAMEIALLGDRFNAEKALSWGLVNEVVASENVDEAAMKLADRLAHGPTAALGRTRRLINASFETGLAEQLDAEKRCFADSAISDDFREGVTAFVEKRKPEFTGQ